MFPSRRIITSGGDVYRDEYSLEFDGTNDYISVADSADLSFGDGSNDSAFSISAWIKMDDATDFTIAHKGEFGNDIEWRFSTYNDDDIKFICGDDSAGTVYIGRTYDTAITSYEGTWIHLAGTYDGSSASSGFKIYLNGIQVDDTNYGSGSYTAMENQGEPVQIGRYDSTYSDGKISEVSIWNTELSSNQVKQLYNGREPFDARNVAKSNLVSYWRMGDGVLDHRQTNGLVADQVTATLGSELVTNGDMEIDDNWVDFNTPTVNAQSQEQVYSGSYSWKLTTDSNDGIKQTGISVVAGKLYKFTYWVYPVGNTTIGTALNDGSWQLDKSTTGLTADTWNEVTHYVKAGNSASAYIIINDRASVTGTWYIDDVSIKLVNGNAGTLVNFDGSDFKTDVPR